MPTISLTVEAADPAEVDQLTRQLRTELLALDLDDVDFADAPAPPVGAKGLDPTTVSTVVVAVAGSPVLVQLGRVVQDFANRGRHRKIVARDGERSVEITGGDPADNQQIIETFFRRS
jgi:hypothetical protein